MEEWDKAEDEVLDEMTGKEVYQWGDIQLAVRKMRDRWESIEK